MKTHGYVTLWELLGFPCEAIEAEHKWLPVNRETWWCEPPPQSMEAESWTFGVLSNGRRIFALGWMGSPLPEHPLNDWREAGRRIAGASNYYFYGPWREKFTWNMEDHDHKSSRSSMPWSNAYRAGLALACAFSDWEIVDKLLAWPRPDLPPDEGTDDRTDEDNAYQIWLAMTLRGEVAEDAASQRRLAQKPTRREGDFESLRAFRKVRDVLPGVDAIAGAAIGREMIQRGSRRRPKMLMAAADAMLAGKAVEFGKALGAYLKHYRQRELKLQRVDTGICLDAMVLWHLARRRGMGEVPLPDDVFILIARP